ncbi:hypothetical protein [Pinibacter aurantiacus]|uniref:T9SS C-terminal target domain-containing protein n=1 Tax=Pinibacter aurantiacus TaxID=2851599 RepID=A0A9E2W4Z0_9BACT|nr:hypothetical protein [Pinibacter aurantiacus]MBV4358068.1 hypothetical protein [Pinibacter aurantiacus]
MKKIAAFLLLGSFAFSIGCKKSDSSPDPSGGGNTGGDVVNPATNTVDIRGVIKADRKFTKDKTYRLRGYVYVTDGATLTIEPGTKIVSNKDSAGVLVIYRDATIVADGNADNPIVFTSNETTKAPGDLGGVVLVGQAKGNNNHTVIEGGVDAAFSAFGGTNDAHSSGTLRYVRIEYAGKAVNPGDEINGLSLYGVGSGTTIDYIQVIRGLDDAFEFFGGAVNCKHLIAYNCADDDFDMDDGYRGMIQYAISIKDPKFTDAKGTTGDISNNFEVDNVNPSNGFQLSRTPITAPTLSNFTAVGPNNASGTSTDYGYGMRWRRGARFVLANSIVMGGQKAGLDIDDDSTANYYKNDTSRFYNSFLHSVANNFQLGNSSAVKVYDVASLQAKVTGNDLSAVYADPAAIKLTDPFNTAAPNVKPATGSPALSTAGKFDYRGLTNAFFDKTSFVGAMDATNDWTAKWTVWNK